VEEYFMKNPNQKASFSAQKLLMMQKVIL